MGAERPSASITYRKHIRLIARIKHDPLKNAAAEKDRVRNAIYKLKKAPNKQTNKTPLRTNLKF